jgi:phosphoglycolate phosphatase
MREAFGPSPGQSGYAELRDEFLHLYAQRLLRGSGLLNGVAAMLEGLDAAGRPWGIVTNKSLALASALVQGLDLQPAALVGGDSTPFTEPHREPLLEAARRLAVAPQACVYVCDDPRDMRAGRAAGMATAAAAWGYHGIEEPIEQWPADVTLGSAGEVLVWLGVP